MPSKGWFNLESGNGGVIPDTQFFEGDSAFKFLGLSRTTRLYGFIAWYVSPPPLSLPTVRYLRTRLICETNSLAIGFLLSLLGSIVLFLGQLGSFAGECGVRVVM